ncbi:MAG: hypothetical protein Kow0062_26610 [Acidobacteriota bacterium]
MTQTPGRFSARDELAAELRGALITNWVLCGTLAVITPALVRAIVPASGPPWLIWSGVAVLGVLAGGSLTHRVLVVVRRRVRDLAPEQRRRRAVQMQVAVTAADVAFWLAFVALGFLVAG